MKHEPIIVDRTPLDARILAPMAPEPLDIFTLIVGAAIVAIMFFAWIS